MLAVEFTRHRACDFNRAVQQGKEVGPGASIGDLRLKSASRDKQIEQHAFRRSVGEHVGGTHNGAYRDSAAIQFCANQFRKFGFDR